MLPLVFLGGAIVGAAGLLGAALYDKGKEDRQYSPSLKHPESLEGDDVARQLNAYFMKAQEIYMKCNEVVIESSELISTPIELPDDDIFQKATNVIGCKLTTFCRFNRKHELLTLKEDTLKLYGRYKGVFKRANDILKERGRSSIDLKPISYKGNDIKINSSYENDNWDLELGELADQIRAFIEKSCDIAEKLIDILEGRETILAIEAGNA